MGYCWSTTLKPLVEALTILVRVSWAPIDLRRMHFRAKWGHRVISISQYTAGRYGRSAVFFAKSEAIDVRLTVA